MTDGGEGSTVSVTSDPCTDLAGNTARRDQRPFKIDKTAPVITDDGRTPAANANGWNNTDVTDDVQPAPTPAQQSGLASQASARRRSPARGLPVRP